MKFLKNWNESNILNLSLSLHANRIFKTESYNPWRYAPLWISVILSYFESIMIGFWFKCYQTKSVYAISQLNFLLIAWRMT